MLAIFALIICFGLLLSVAINRLLARLGIRPVDPDAASGGFADVAARVKQWQESRRTLK